MAEDKNTDQKIEHGDVIEITPVDSPSENFLVAEKLRQMPNIFARGLIYIIVLLILVSLAYSLFSKIDVVTESRSVAIPKTHIININSSLSGYVQEIYIAKGQLVEKNDPLFVVLPPLFINSRESISYQSKIAELSKAIPLQDETYNTKISAVKDEMKAVEYDLNYLRKEVENLKTEFANTEKLYEKKLTSIAEYNNIKSRLERALTDIDKLESQKTMLEKNIRSLELEKSTTLQGMRNELETNEKLLALKGLSSYQQSSEDNNKEGKVIRAIESGTILELNFRNKGEYVRESDILCTIVPADAALYMDITVANKDAGFIETGMEIKYKFDAFPYSDYGTISGKVKSISLSAIEDKTLGYVYHVDGSLDRIYYEVRGKKYYIKSGMTATAEIVTQKKTIFSILFSKLKR
ncbi:MAG: HlyD family efflux transporter periplasmic adaptor subunit [Deltaproteobacteria bacterium]|nr:HlyD family efflux transporter periplasmic adaptor subunit [Deltaproteobacteria bacterium]